MRRSIMTLTAAAAAALLGAATLTAQYPTWPSDPYSSRAQPGGYQPIYRLHDRALGDHVYTTDLNEVRTLQLRGTHDYEGVTFSVLSQPYDGTRPLYRFARPDGKHYLDTRRSAAIEGGGQLEATLGYVDAAPRAGLVPLQVWVNDRNGLFFYTSDPRGEVAGQIGYSYRGTLGYVAPAR